MRRNRNAVTHSNSYVTQYKGGVGSDFLRIRKGSLPWEYEWNMRIHPEFKQDIIYHAYSNDMTISDWWRITEFIVWRGLPIAVVNGWKNVSDFLEFIQIEMGISENALSLLESSAPLKAFQSMIQRLGLPNDGFYIDGMRREIKRLMYVSGRAA